jgi:hypothetical protein
MTSSITFRFIRNSNASGQDDDLAIIHYQSKDVYRIVYKCPYTNSGSTNKSVTMFLNDRETFRWVRRVLNLLEVDTQPFEGLQLDMPTMPSIMVNPKKIPYSTILDAVEFQLDNWNSFFTQQKKVEEEEEDDMPELVPIRSPPRIRRQLFQY